MGQATITVTADTSTIRLILSILEGEGWKEADVADNELRKFVGSLNQNCSEVVRTIAASKGGGTMSRTALLQAIVFEDDRTPDDMQLNGVIGTIGKRWKEFVSGENPFLGRRGSADQEWTYRIDPDLAARLMREFQGVADRWRAQLPDS